VSVHPLRVGFFGLLAQGNLGNDGSLEAMLAFVRDRHPAADIDVLCPRPEEITRRGLPMFHRLDALSCSLLEGGDEDGEEEDADDDRAAPDVITP